MIDCDYCTGSYDLADDPELGPCVCCTPANMRALDVALDVALDECGAAQNVRSLLSGAGDALARYLRRLGLDPRALKLEDPDLDELLDLLGT